MPTLAAPPPPTTQSPRSAPSLELTSVSFFGRTLAEYAQFFALDVAALRGRDVLDVAAGPSSFTAEACARKIDAVAVDPLYGSTPDALGVLHDLSATLEVMRSRGRPPDLVALCAAREPDASTGTNAGELRLLGIADPLVSVSRGGALEELEPLVHALLTRA